MYNSLVETFVLEIPNSNGARKVYSTLIDWNVERWAEYIKIIGITPKVLERLQQLGIEEAVIEKLSAQLFYQ